MIRTPQPAGRRPETADEDHGGASPLEAPVSSKRSSIVQSKPDANTHTDIVVEAPTPPTDSMSDDGGYLPEGYRKAESSLASDDKIARVLELCVSQVTEESENDAADDDDDDDENSAVADNEGASINEHVQSSKPPLTEEEKELKRREKREKKRRKKEKKAKKKAKKEATKARRDRKSIANQSSEPSESTSHVEESEATTSNMEESETSIQEETPHEEIIKEEIASGTTASSLTSSVRSATKHEEVKEEETQKDGAPVVAPALPSTSSKQVNLGPRSSARVQAAALPLAAQPTEPAPALNNTQPSNWTARKTPPAIGGDRRPVGRPTGRPHVGTVPVVADSNSSNTSSKVKNGPRSSAGAKAAATLPIAAECTEPAHANANSQPSNWIDRKTRPATCGERRPAGRPQQVARVPVVVDSSSSSSGYSPWTPSSRPGQPRTVLVSGKLDSKKINELRKINDDNDKAKEIVEGGDFDVEKGGSDIEDEAPQEYVKEIFEKGVDKEQAYPAERQPGAFNIRGNRQPSMQSTVMSANTSVLDNINASDDDAPVDADFDAPLIAHLVPEEELSYDKIVVAVEHTEPRRRLCLMVAGFLVVFLLVGIVLAVTLGKKPTQPPEEPELWYHVADPIDGDTDSGEFGSSVSICSDGSRVAIGAQGSGEVKVFELDGKHDGGRIQIGQILNCTHSLAMVSASFIRSRVVVELAPNCNVLAIGCPFSSVGNKSMAGIVKLFKYESASDSWEQLGNIIKGEDDSDLSGASLALSQTGDRIAIGSPGNDWVEEDAGQVRVFHINNGRWEIVGMPINGTFPGEEFGGSVSLANEPNFDTHMMAVGSSSRRTIRDTYGEIDPESNVAVRVYELETGSWSQLGQGIIPEVLGLDTAWFVKLSSDGMELVVSNLYLDLDLDGSGINEDNNGIYIAAFELDSQSKMWVPRGGIIHRNFPGKKSGYIISLSDDGQRIGMGDPGRAEVGGLSGHAHFYEFNGDRWCQLGPNINGESAGDMAGYSVSLSGNGKRMVIASPYNRAQGREYGRVTVVELHEDKIVPQCEAI